jgi:hypothetical protein
MGLQCVAQPLTVSIEQREGGRGEALDAFAGIAGECQPAEIEIRDQGFGLVPQ